MPFLAWQGTRLWYRESGAGGIPLVLVHGAGGSSTAWLPVLRRLGRSRRVLALDLPGHGRSGIPGGAGPGGLTLAVYADAVRHLAAAAGAGRYAVAGHSMGGAVALPLAIGWPDDVAAVALVASAARFPIAPDLIEGLRSRFHAAVARLHAEAFSPRTDPDLARRAAPTLISAAPEVVARDFALCRQADLRPLLGRVTRPVWVAAGDDDRLTPPSLAEELAGGIPGARLAWFPRAGHVPFLEREEAFAAALLAFLDEVA